MIAASTISVLPFGQPGARAADYEVTTVVGDGTPMNAGDNVPGATIFEPTSISRRPDGKYFVAARNQIRLLTLAPTSTTGTISTPVNGATEPSLNGPIHVAAMPDGIGGDGVVLVANHLGNQINGYPDPGAIWRFGTGVQGSADGLHGDAEFDRPYGVAVTTNGTVLIADTFNHTIRLSAGGDVSTRSGLRQFSGFADGSSNDARFNSPVGIAIDANDEFAYVADQDNHAIRRVDINTGSTLTIAGGGPLAAGFLDGVGADAQFRSPDGVTVADDGTVYVADTGNHAIRRIRDTPAGWVVDTIAGTGIVGFADGPNGTAQFSSPYGLALEPGDNSLLVADLANHRIRRVAIPPYVAPAWAHSIPPSPTPAGSPYSYQFHATATNPPTYRVTAGLLPNGLTLDPDGRLHGTPSSVGTHLFEVSTSNGLTVTATLRVTSANPSAIGINTNTTDWLAFTSVPLAGDDAGAITPQAVCHFETEYNPPSAYSCLDDELDQSPGFHNYEFWDRSARPTARWIARPPADPGTGYVPGVDPEGTAETFFRTRFTLPDPLPAGAVASARFSLVADNSATVFVNDSRVGETPHENAIGQLLDVDIASRLRPGVNEVLIRLRNFSDPADPSDDPTAFLGWGDVRLVAPPSAIVEQYASSEDDGSPFVHPQAYHYADALTVGSDGSVYLSGYGGVSVLRTDGSLETITSQSGGEPELLPDGSVITADPDTQSLVRYAPDSASPPAWTRTDIVDPDGNLITWDSAPGGIARLSDGTLIVSTYGSISKLTPSGSPDRFVKTTLVSPGDGPPFGIFFPGLSPAATLANQMQLDVLTAGPYAGQVVGLAGMGLSGPSIDLYVVRIDPTTGEIAPHFPGPTFSIPGLQSVSEFGLRTGGTTVGPDGSVYLSMANGDPASGGGIWRVQPDGAIQEVGPLDSDYAQAPKNFIGVADVALDTRTNPPVLYSLETDNALTPNQNRRIRRVIEAPPRAVSFAAPTFPEAKVGEYFESAFVDTPSTVFDLTAGKVPPGLSLAPSGMLFGVPTAAGTYTFAVTAAGTKTVEATLAVTGPANTPTFATDQTWDVYTTDPLADPAAVADHTAVPSCPALYGVAGAGCLADERATHQFGFVFGLGTTGRRVGPDQRAEQPDGARTVWFRKQVTLAEPAFSGDLTVLSPDPVKVFINGTEIAPQASGPYDGMRFLAPIESVQAGVNDVVIQVDHPIRPPATLVRDNPIWIEARGVFTTGASAPTMSSSVPPSAAVVGSAYGHTYTAVGNPTPTYELATGDLPPGLTLDSDTGVLTGTPTTAGTYAFAVRARNGVNPPAIQPATIVVSAAPEAPVFTSGPPPSPARANQPYTGHVFAASGYPAPTFTVEHFPLPAGLVLDASTGELSGVPTIGGSFSFTVRASNSQGSDVQPVTIVVQSPAQITSPPPPEAARVGEQYLSFSVTATGFPAPTFGLISLPLPPGLSLDSVTGVISGTPTQAGVFDFTITATNGVGDVASQPGRIVVAGPPEFTSGGTPEFVVAGSPFSHQFTTAGTPSPVVTVTGTMPSWLSFDPATNTLSGVAPRSAAGTSVSLVATADNGEAPAAQQFIAFTVRSAPQFSSTAPTAAAADSVFTYTPTVDAFPSPSFSSVGLPSWLSLNPTTGTITGTPPASEVGSTVEFEITATNAAGEATLAVALLITAAPVFTSGPVPSGVAVDAEYEHVFTAIGAPSPVLSVVGALPSWLSFDPATGRLAGTAPSTAVGVLASFAIRAANASGSVSSPVSITVGKAPAFVSPVPAGPYRSGQAISPHTFSTDGFPVPSISVTDGTLPAGLEISTGGVFSGVPTETGLFSFTVRASNTYGAATQAVIVAVDRVPAFSAASPPNGSFGQSYSYTFEAVAVPAAAFTVTDGSLPPGVDLSSTGLLSGTPTATGDFTFTVNAANRAGDVEASFTVQIRRAATFGQASPPAGAVGVDYSYTFTATGVPSTVAYSLGTGSVPPGLTLSGTGVLSGTPTTSGTYTFEVVASNGVNPDAVRSVTMLVGTPPVFSPTSVPNATRTLYFERLFVATGVPSTITYGVVDVAALPPGLSVNAQGYLLGTPTASGTFSFVITASNGVGPATLRPVTLVVDEPVAPVFVTTSPLPNATVGVPYPLALQVTGVPAPWTFGLQAGSNMPPGVVMSPSTGALSGTPTVAGSYSFTVRASNGVAPDAVRTFVIQVEPAPTAPAITVASPPLSGTVGVTYPSYTFVATGVPTPAFSAVGSVPPGLTLSGTGVLSGAPTAAGSFTFTVRASNGVSPADEKTFTFTIAPAEVTPLVITSALPSGTATAGTTYVSHTFQATPTTPTRSWGIASGALPLGMTLSAEGVLSGTPTSVGVHRFLVEVSNGGANLPARQEVAITVAPGTGATSVVFNSDNTWDSFTGLTLPGTGAVSVGKAQELCPESNPPSVPCLSGRVDLSTIFGDYGADRSSFPAANWVWLPGVTADTPDAADVGGWFRTSVEVGGVPTGGVVHLAADDGAEVFVNGTSIGAVGILATPVQPVGHSPLRSLVIPAGVLVQGANVITVRGLNGATAGGYNVNPAGVIVHGEISFTAPVAPAFVATVVPPGVVGVGYSHTFVATGVPSSMTYSLGTGSLPPGLTLSTAGVLSGEPSAGGTFTFSVKASNGIAPDAVRSVTVAVSAPPLFVSTSPLPSATVGVSYTATLVANGVPAVSAFSVQTGSALPPGIELNPATGALSGTPTTAGSYSFIVIATNGVAPAATRSFVVNVASGPTTTTEAPSTTNDDGGAVHHDDDGGAVHHDDDGGAVHQHDDGSACFDDDGGAVDHDDDGSAAASGRSNRDPRDRPCRYRGHRPRRRHLLARCAARFHLHGRRSRPNRREGVGAGHERGEGPDRGGHPAANDHAPVERAARRQPGLPTRGRHRPQRHGPIGHRAAPRRLLPSSRQATGGPPERDPHPGRPAERRDHRGRRLGQCGHARGSAIALADRLRRRTDRAGRGCAAQGHHPSLREHHERTPALCRVADRVHLLEGRRDRLASRHEDGWRRRARCAERCPQRCPAADPGRW